MKVHAPAHTPTQTPVTTRDEPTYARRRDVPTRSRRTRGRSLTGTPTCPGAWRVAIEPVPAGPTRWPWRASLAKAELEATWNRANVVLPAQAGRRDGARAPRRPAGTKALRVTLLRDGVEHETREVPLP